MTVAGSLQLLALKIMPQNTERLEAILKHAVDGEPEFTDPFEDE